MNTRVIGAKYEDIACRTLTDAGMTILARNYSVRIGEIDIIAKDHDEIVFVEVKYRKNTAYGGAEYAISKAKQNKIRRVAEWFLAENGYSQSTFCRFDAVLIDGEHVEHIRNAW